MTRFHALPAVILVFIFLLSPALAADKKELRKQRQLAQKERQAEKKERTNQIRDSHQDFRAFTRDQENVYREMLADLTIEFQIQEIELKAEHEARVAAAEAEYQKKVTGLFMTSGIELNEQSIQKYQADAKTYAAELFALKKQSAAEVHKAWIANEKRKNQLLTDKDQSILAEADSLGLTKDHPPIIATAIGDGLTTTEERWNESEKKAVAKIKQKNLKTLSKYKNGEKIRSLELKYANEDFKLRWDEKAEIQALDSKQLFYNVLLMQANQGAFDQQKFLNELAEDNKKKNLIKIKYKKVADKNRILRNKEKKEILANY